jgi:hypothetical protein
MAEFKRGDKVVHLGGKSGLNSRNRGQVMTIIDGPYSLKGWAGVRYIVDVGVYLEDAGETVHYHANAAHLLHLRYAKNAGI